MAPARLRPAFVSLFATLAILFAALPALADPMLAVVAGTPTRPGVQRNQANLPNGVSFADCESDLILTFSLTAAQGTFTTGADTLQIWAGTGDCTQTTARAAVQSGTCQPVSAPAAVSATMQVSVHSRDLVNASLGVPSPGDGSLVAQPKSYHDDDSVCFKRTGSAGTPLTISFDLFAAGGGTADAEAASINFAPATGLAVTVDTVGPPLPTLGSAAVGDTLIKLLWTPAENATDTYGFQWFCDPPPNQPADAAGPSLADGAAATTQVCVDASATGDDSSAGNDSSTLPRIITDNDGATDAAGDALDAEAGVVTDSSTLADSASGTCGSTDACMTSKVILENINGGAISSLGFYNCGSNSDKSSNGTAISGLINGVSYTFGVAATDLIGNVGSVAVYPCATPQPINDFWTTYRNDGGNAGGSFCALDGVGMPVGTSLMGLSVLVAGIGLVRRRRNR